MKIFFFLCFGILFFASLNAQTVSLVADKDNTIYSQFANNSNGAGEYFFVGRNSQGNLMSVQRSLLHFDLSSIPVGSIINSVTLTLYVSKSAPSPTGIELHKAAADWGQGASDSGGSEAAGVAALANDATWNMRFSPATAWSIAGGEFLADVSAGIDIGSGIGIPTAFTLAGNNLVADLQAWVNNAGSNFGWLIKSNNENTSASVKRFVSRENAASSQRPSLFVTYTPGSLPVTLKSFTAGLLQKNTLLQWTTATEVNSDYFAIEHSANGQQFKIIGRVKATGNATTEKNYTFTHLNVPGGKNYYRLAQYDLNEGLKYSSVVVVNNTFLFNIKLTPNPVIGSLSITGNNFIGATSFIIRSAIGSTVAKGTLTGQSVDVAKLNAGIYFITLVNNGSLESAVFFKK